MNHILYLDLQGFYCKALNRPGSPLVVHQAKVILDVSSEAQDKGIYRGMALSEAKAVSPNLTYVEWKEEPYRAAQEQWLQFCADYSDRIEPLDQHQAYIDLSDHPQPAQVAQLLVNKLKKITRLQIAYGVSQCKWVAQIAAYYPNRASLAWRDPADFVWGLPTMQMISLAPEVRERLRFLGYTSICEVSQIPLEVLKEQFGDTAYEIERAAQGRGDSLVDAVFPKQALAVRLNFEGPIDDALPLQNAIEDLSEELSADLREHDQIGKTLDVILELEDGTPRVYRRTFVKPLQSKESIVTAANLTLSELPSQKIAAVRFRLVQLQHAPRIQQELGVSLGRLQKETAAFHYVRQVFGNEAVLKASHVQEPRRKKLLRVWRECTGWV